MKARNFKIVDSLPDNRSKSAFMAGGKVTIEMIWQLADGETKKLKRWYIAKVRGIPVSDGDRFKFETPEEARAFGNEMKNYWKEEATKDGSNTQGAI